MQSNNNTLRLVCIHDNHQEGKRCVRIDPGQAWAEATDAQEDMTEVVEVELQPNIHFWHHLWCKKPETT